MAGAEIDAIDPGAERIVTHSNFIFGAVPMDACLAQLALAGPMPDAKN